MAQFKVLSNVQGVPAKTLSDEEVLINIPKGTVLTSPDIAWSYSALMGRVGNKNYKNILLYGTELQNPDLIRVQQVRGGRRKKTKRARKSRGKKRTTRKSH